MIERVVIIGGGVAGLSAAIQLAELGFPALVVEGGSYPAHKVCGEFLSPECLPILNRWHIHPTEISSMSVYTLKRKISLSFPSLAGGLSHLTLDPLLAKLALRKGAKIKTQTQVISFKPKSANYKYHQIQLSSGETIEAEQAIIATGRIPSFSDSHFNPYYDGCKVHLKHVPLRELKMFSFKGGYLGISPIENSTVNMACLASKRVFNLVQAHEWLERIKTLHPDLAFLLQKSEIVPGSWKTTPVPAFGIKETPPWPDVFFIGDAALTIPPASGSGLSLAILGGCLAAEHAVHFKSSSFKSFWRNHCTKQVFWAKSLHHLFLNPMLSNPLLKIAQWMPSLSHHVFKLTRQRIRLSN